MNNKPEVKSEDQNFGYLVLRDCLASVPCSMNDVTIYTGWMYNPKTHIRLVTPEVQTQEGHKSRERIKARIESLEQANAKLQAEIDSLKLQQLVKPQTEEKV